jgi:hypothetical protein
MKKVLFIASMALLSFNGFSQYSKGSMFASGMVGISSSSQGDDKNSSFEFSPSFGYFLTDNIAVGASVGIGSNTAEVGSVKTTDESTFSFGGFARYYTTPANNFSFFANLGVAYASATDNIAPKVKTTGFGLSVAPGVSYFLSKHIAMETSIGILNYSTAKSDVEGSKAKNDLNIGLGLSNVNFGFVYKF